MKVKYDKNHPPFRKGADLSEIEKPLYDKYYIYQGYGKPRTIKDRLLTKLGPNFRGLITLITMKVVFGYSKDHNKRSYHYVLDNTMWTKISNDARTKLVAEHELQYEHIDSDWINEGVVC